jgi:3-oxoacyl-[acyl-carrier-protein] synthase-3
LKRYIRIRGAGSALPERRVSNHDLVKELATKGIETSDDWITTRTGIRFRHYAEPQQKASDLALVACNRALKSSGVQKEDIDLIVMATSTPDHLGGFPSTAAVLQHKLGITNTGAAFDVQAVCTGYLYAMTVADALMKTGCYRNALVVGAEVFSQIIDFEDRSTCVLFGDGAGAVVLGHDGETGIHGAKLHADGSQAEILKVPGRVANGLIEGSPYLYMEGSAVFRSGVKAMADVIVSVLEEHATSVDELDWLILHQANIRILHAVAKQIDLPVEKLIVTVDKHGNTSAASIPLALDTSIREGKIKRGQKVMLAAVGGGLTWGAMLLNV